MARIGYARVSTVHQDEASQIKTLKEAGCELIFHEKISTRTADHKREQLQAALSQLAEGDVLVVSKLDRLGRTQVEVINRLDQLQKTGIHVETLDGLINTKGLGKFAPVMVGLLTGIAEVERELIRERTMESLAYRRATGGDLGGRRKSYTREQAELVRSLRADGDSLRVISRKVNLSLGAVQRILG